MIQNRRLKRRIVELSYKHKLGHIGSCLTAVDIIKEIYDQKTLGDKFILSNGHAGLALYVVLEFIGNSKAHDGEDLYYMDAESMLEEHGIHPCNSKNFTGETPTIDCSTGSLGQGLPIAVGMALADKTRAVHCLISDGECGEGSIWEALRIIDELGIDNIEIYVNINGYAAYKTVDTIKLSKRLREFLDGIRLRYTSLDGIPHLDKMGILAHYRVLDEKEYADIMEALRDE